MKRIVIDIDDKYGSVLSITAVGVDNITTNVTVAAIDLAKKDYVKINENGKVVEEC